VHLHVLVNVNVPESAQIPGRCTLTSTSTFTCSELSSTLCVTVSIRMTAKGCAPGPRFGSNWLVPLPFFHRFELGSAKIRIDDQRCRWTPVGLIGLLREMRGGSNWAYTSYMFPWIRTRSICQELRTTAPYCPEFNGAFASSAIYKLNIAT
jgi:hypothetical protein